MFSSYSCLIVPGLTGERRFVTDWEMFDNSFGGLGKGDPKVGFRHEQQRVVSS